MADENKLWPIIKAATSEAWRIEGVLQKGVPDVWAIFDSKYMTFEMKDVPHGGCFDLSPEQIAWCSKTGRRKAPHFIVWIYRDGPDPKVCIVRPSAFYTTTQEDRQFRKTLDLDTHLPEQVERWFDLRGICQSGRQTLGRLRSGQDPLVLQLRQFLSCQ